MNTKLHKEDPIETKERLWRKIDASPVVGYCTKDCGNEIRQREIEIGIADENTCAGCVLDYVASICTW